ncbi:MAG TPA: Ppx/GppA family phosphatase [Verrucomicrobiae bacterium]|jgi:exopolyphosphatase/guanosine-5'-triphosphate,3'-diphosphate pyrophosphatase|nr:Ppx/GppA family phosphatase [Verrucomicrobiae bacterium]
MSHTPRAVIDVGTNSVKLLVAEIRGRDVRPILEDSKQTRLGHGFYETHRLQAEPIEKTAKAVTAFAAKARELKAESIRVVATSAARDAINPQDLVSAIEVASGLKVEIISGETEAEWAFHGVTTDPALATRPLLLLDVGGGSTEFILGQGDYKHFRESFPLGTVRLMEKVPHSDPPRREELTECRIWLKTFFETEVQPKLAPKMNWGGEIYSANTGLQLVGTGGTASILARMELKAEDYNREAIEATRLSLERVRWHVRNLWSRAFAEREKIIGLPPKRADVILTGAAIYEAVMEQFGFAELRVSTRGLRFAALMDA